MALLRVITSISASESWRLVMVLLIICVIMMSTCTHSVTARQRRLVPDDGNHDVNNIKHLAQQSCDHGDEACSGSDQAMHGKPRSLLNVDHDIPIFVRYATTGLTQTVEVNSMGRVSDLRQAAADAFGLESHRLQVYYGGIAIPNHETLADKGIGPECMVEIRITDDVDNMLDFIADFMPLIWREPEHSDMIKQEILDKKQEVEALAMQRGTDYVDYSEAINLIQSRLKEHSSVTVCSEFEGEDGGSPSPRICGILILINFLFRQDEDRHAVGKDFRWQSLPEKTRELTVRGWHYMDGVSMVSISLQHIYCPNLRKLQFISLRQLTRLDLNGIERCTALEELRIVTSLYHELTALVLGPLGRACRGGVKLKSLDLPGIALPGLDLSPLSDCDALQYLGLGDFERDLEDFERDLEELDLEEADIDDQQLLQPLQHLMNRDVNPLKVVYGWPIDLWPPP